MNGATQSAGQVVMTDPNWSVTHMADTNGDGKSDLLWRRASDGATALWLMNGLTPSSSTFLQFNPQWILSPADGF